MWASLCSFLYGKFFSKREIDSSLSKNHSNNCVYGKRLKLSNSLSDRKASFIPTNRKFSMQGKENFLENMKDDDDDDDDDDDECCIIAEVKRKKPGCFTKTRSDNLICSKFEPKIINFHLAPSIEKKSVVEEDSKDIEIVKCVKNISSSNQCFKSHKEKYKFFTTPRTPMSISKGAKSKMIQKNLLKKRLNCLQENYHLTEKLQYIQLLQSHTSNLLNTKTQQNTLTLPKKIPLIDLTEDKSTFDFKEKAKNCSISLTPNESSNKTGDQDMQIIKEIPKVNFYKDILKSTPINLKDVFKEISLKQSEKNKAKTCISQLKCDAINLLDDIGYKKKCPEELEVKLQTLMHITEPQTEKQEKEDLKYLLPKITIEQEARIQNAFVKDPREEVLVQEFGLVITRSDMQTLKGLNWLNDEIINFYMILIMERSKQNQSLPKVYSFNTFFYPQLVSKGYSKVKRWTKKVNLFSFDLIFVPIHLEMHWCLSVIDFRFKSIKYYDSIGSFNDSCLEHLLSYLKSESKDKQNKPLNSAFWTKKNVEDIPQQMNGSDCGVFSCMFAEYLARDMPINFTQENMVYFRKKMVLEILEKKLLT